MQNYKLSEDEIIEFLNTKTETKNKDFKEDLNWNSCYKSEKIEIIKDILAMSNTQDGGIIIFGVKDSDCEFIGLLDENFDSFDQTKVNDLLNEYTEPKFTCQVHKHIFQDPKYFGKKTVIIIVPEFKVIPIICKKEFTNSSQKLILKCGAIYIRTEKASSESISSSSEMKDLIQRATIKNGDELLKNIELLIKGQSLKGSDKESLSNYKTEITEGLDFLKKNIGDVMKKFGYWQFISYPSIYNPERLKEPKDIDKLIRKSEVDLLGWNLPHTDKDNASNFLSGRQSYTIWKEFIEGYRAYSSGLLLWQRVLIEDTKSYNIGGKPVIDFIRTIRYVTEILNFLFRYYMNFIKEGEIIIEIFLKNIMGRQIFTVNPILDIRENYYISKENDFHFKEIITFLDLKIHWQEIANKIIRKIFLIFNAEDISIKIITDWQNKILTRSI